MSRDVALTPLGYVQESFWRYTDRCPSDEQAVFDMVEAATIDTFGADKAATFTTLLAESLDPDTPGFGVVNALRLEEIGKRVSDSEAPVVVKWGSLALLGALHAVYDKEALASPDYDPLTRHEQVASHIAHGALLRIVDDPACDTPQRTVAKAFLNSLPAMRSEDLGAEINLYKHPETFTSVQHQPAEHESTEEINEPVTDMGEVAFAETDPNISNILAKLPWLDTNIDTAPLFKISEEKGDRALLYDLTGFNKTLRKYREDVKSNTAVNNIFWNKLPAGLIKHAIKNGTTTHKTSVGYVPTYYLTNRGSRNEHTLRVYYVQLGSTTEKLPIFGMIAACRTKRREHITLRLITPISNNNKDPES